MHFILWAHICYYKSILRDAYRDTNNRSLDELGKKVTVLTTAVTELSKVVIAALGDHKPSNPDGTKSVFIHSKHLPCLERIGYEALAYWDREPWLEIRNRRTAVDTEDPILVLFYEDENGSVVSKAEIRAVRNTARSYFQLLWDNNRAPTCWSDAPLDVRIDFVRRLEEEYKWLRYCNRHWKAEQVFMNYYPHWYRSKINIGKRASKRKERAENQENEDDCGNPSGSKRPRAEDVKPILPLVQPVSARASGRRNKVSLLVRLVFTFADSLKNNPL